MITTRMQRALDLANADVGRAQLRVLSLIAEVDRGDAWRPDGARDVAHWVSMRYGISAWKARRWVASAHALQELPRIAGALGSGELGLDKVVELTRFATAATEAKLLRWAAEVSCGAVRRRAERDERPQIEVDREAIEARCVRWWWLDEDRRIGLEAEVPAVQGRLVIAALERMAGRIPAMPGEEGSGGIDARRADALVALCSATVADDPDPDRATVIVHARAERLLDCSGGCELEDGPALHPATVQRLLCNARLQTVVEDARGDAVAFGHMRREPSAAMVWQVRYRDRECRFPGCGAKAFTEAHHVVWWSRGGRTDLDNLVLVCSFHHRLVHELGWRLTRDAEGEVRWFRPNGRRYRAGPSAARRATREPAA